jgi:hypothetical protein
MSDTSRRGFLAIAGVGAAGVAVAGTVGASSLSSASSGGKSPSTSVPSTKLPSDASGSLVAYVTDVRNGQLSVLVGDREVVIHDQEIVARLAQAAKTSEV